MAENKITIVAHSSQFHPDDVFAVATLILFLKENPNIEIVRSRDVDVINKADYVVDVGMVYDSEKRRFDHHQEGGAGLRANGVPYASFGLVWKEYGEAISGSKDVMIEVDNTFVQPIDAIDNGVGFFDTKVAGLYPFDVSSLTFIFAPTWKEADVNIDEIFTKLVFYAKEILKRYITVKKDENEAKQYVLEAYKNASDKRLIEINERYPWAETLSKFPEPLYVIYKNRDNNWSIKCVMDDIFSFNNRKPLPENWAGKISLDLEKETKVEGSIFCHKNRFMAVNKTREGILKMAKIALES